MTAEAQSKPARSHVPAPLLHGAALSFSSLVASSGFIFLANVLLARLLGAEAVGVYAILTAVLGVAVSISLLGLETGILRTFPPLTESEAGLRRIRPLTVLAVATVLLVATAMGAALAFLSPWVSDAFGASGYERAFFYVFLGLPLLAVNVLGLAIFRVLRWFATEAVLGGIVNRGIRPTILLAAAYILSEALTPSGGIMAMVLGGEAISVTLIIGVLWSRLPSGTGAAMRETLPVFEDLRRFSLPVMPAMVIQTSLQHADLLVLGVLAASAEVGVFRAAALIALTMTLVMRSFGSAFAPRISADYTSGRRDDLGQAYRDVALAILTVTLPLFFVFVVNRVWLLGLFGGDFVPLGTTLLVILGCGQLINASTGQVGYMLLLTGNRDHYIWTAVLTAIVVVSATAWGYTHWGLVGAAFGSSLATAFVNLMRAGLVRWKLGVHPFSRAQGLVVAIGLSLTFSADWIVSSMSVPTAATLTLSGLTASLAVWGALRYSSRLSGLRRIA